MRIMDRGTAMWPLLSNLRVELVAQLNKLVLLLLTIQFVIGQRRLDVVQH